MINLSYCWDEYLSESHAISHFINGLRPYVAKAVRLFMPQTLIHAYALARLQDTSNPVREGFSPNAPKKFSNQESKLSGNPPLLPTPIMPAFKNRRVLTEEQLTEYRAKGLCYGCDEKFERGHRCGRKQLYILEVDDSGTNDYVVDEVVGNEGVQCENEDNPLISIHAINGSVSKGFRTMRILGRVGKRSVHILIDSGSTHNFLDIHLAKRLNLPLTQVKPVMVDVADGNRLECDSMCKGLKWLLSILLSLLMFYCCLWATVIWYLEFSD